MDKEERDIVNAMKIENNSPIRIWAVFIFDDLILPKVAVVAAGGEYTALAICRELGADFSKVYDVRRKMLSGETADKLPESVMGKIVSLWDFIDALITATLE